MARDLTEHQPEFRDVVLCPLCYREFPHSAIETRELTLEHVIPEALGGRQLVLSCSTCNHGSGAQIDADLNMGLRSDEALALGFGSLHGRLRSGDISFPLEFRNPERGEAPVFSLRIKGGPKRALEEFTLEEQGELNLEFSCGFELRPFYRAIYKSAYLALSARLGYAYALSPSARIIAGWVTGDISGDPRELVKRVDSPAIETLPTVASSIFHSGSLYAYVVMCTFRKNASHHFLVPLPSSESKPEELFEKLSFMMANLTLRANDFYSLLATKWSQ
jgi:hypothetical protein